MPNFKVCHLLATPSTGKALHESLQHEVQIRCWASGARASVANRLCITHSNTLACMMDFLCGLYERKYGVMILCYNGQIFRFSQYYLTALHTFLYIFSTMGSESVFQPPKGPTFKLSEISWGVVLGDWHISPWNLPGDCIPFTGCDNGLMTHRCYGHRVAKNITVTTNSMLRVHYCTPNAITTGLQCNDQEFQFAKTIPSVPFLKKAMLGT